LLAENV
jgi:hypothetical protein